MPLQQILIHCIRISPALLIIVDQLRSISLIMLAYIYGRISVYLSLILQRQVDILKVFKSGS